MASWRAQVDELTRRLDGEDGPDEEAAAGIDPAQEPQGLRELADWLEALQQLFINTLWKAPRSEPGDRGLTPSQPANMASPIGEDELRHLRVQVAGLAHKLAQSENEPDGKSKRRRLGKRSTLRRLAHRVGIR